MWVLCGEYFLTQAWVASGWNVPFDITQNAISDLGAVTCGMFGGREVCSPDHVAMNAGFIVLGLLMACGAYFLWHHFQTARTGFILIALSGLGAITVGCIPEDTVQIGHVVGATLSFISAGAGMIWCGLKLSLPVWLRSASIGLGALSLISLVALSLGLYETIGFGTVERLVSYPTTLWLMTIGVFLLVTKK
jgi:hypothetical membrane protein